MSEQKFRKKLTIRLWLSILLFLTGIGLVAFTVLQQGGFIPSESYFNQTPGHSGFFQNGYKYGFSLGITFASLATTIKIALWLKKDELFRKQYIKETDERNVNIFRKALSVSWYLTIFTLLIASFFVPSETVVVLLNIMGMSVFSFLLTYFICQRKD